MAVQNYFVIDRVETGSRICAYRKKNHLTRERLAELLDRSGEDLCISINSIGKWERGEVDISFCYAKALAEIFGCKLYGELVVFRLRDFDGELDQLLFPIVIPNLCSCIGSDFFVLFCLYA